MPRLHANNSVAPAQSKVMVAWLLIRNNWWMLVFKAQLSSKWLKLLECASVVRFVENMDDLN